MSAGVTTHQHSDALLRATIKAAYWAKADDTVWKSCGFQEMETQKLAEEFTSFTGIGLAPRKEQLQQIAIDVPKQNGTKRVNIYQYAIMVPVSEEMIRQWRRGLLDERPFSNHSEFVKESMSMTTEILCADLFANAFSTSFLGADGKALVATDHVLGRGGSASNHLGAVSLSESSLEAAIIQGRKFPNDVGLPVGIGSKKRLLVIPEDESFNADRLLKSDKQALTANNAINAIKGQFEARPNRYLGSTTNWFVVNTGVKHSIMVLWEQKEEFKEFGDDRIGAMNFRAYQSVGVDFHNWRGVQGSNFGG